MWEKRGNMEWTQFAVLLVTLAGLFFWNRSEANNDRRHMDAKLEAALQTMNGNVQAIQAEIKDFHGRLCAIEERNRK